MLQSLAQNSGDPGAAIIGLAGFFFCFVIFIGIAQFVIFIVALVQVLSRQQMPTDAKILWIAVCWFLPVLGPILWWTIGSKQHPKAPSQR